MLTSLSSILENYLLYDVFSYFKKFLRKILYLVLLKICSNYLYPIYINPLEFLKTTTYVKLKCLSHKYHITLLNDVITESVKKPMCLMWMVK